MVVVAAANLYLLEVVPCRNRLKRTQQVLHSWVLLSKCRPLCEASPDVGRAVLMVPGDARQVDDLTV